MPPAAGDIAHALHHEDELIKRYFGPRPQQWVPPPPVETVVTFMIVRSVL